MLRIEYRDLLGVSAERWEALVAPLVSLLEEFLPPGSVVRSDPSREVLVVSWTGGPGIYEPQRLITDVLSKSPSYSDGRTVGWPGLDAEFTRSLPPSSRGFALLSAALAGTCPGCSGYGEAFASAYEEALERPSPDLLVSHPNLSGLVALGFSEVRLERLGELLGGLAGSSRDEAERFFHASGHFPGLIGSLEGLGLPA